MRSVSIAIVSLVALMGCASSPCERDVVAVPESRPEMLFKASETPVVPSEEVERVVMLLSAHEFVAGRESFKPNGDELRDVFWAISADEGQRESVRLRAFEVLSSFSGAEVKALFERAVSGLGPVRFQHRAVARYGEVWPADAPRVLGQVLATSSDPQLRLTAAAALMSCCAVEGRALIEQAVEAEQEAWVKEKLRDYQSRPSR